MTDKPISVVCMHTTHLMQTVHLRVSGNTLWWKMTPSSHCVGCVSNPFRTMSVIQKTYNTTNLVHYLKVKHSEQYVEFEKALERGEEDKGKEKEVMCQISLLEASERVQI